MQYYICDECKKPLDEGKRYTRLSEKNLGRQFLPGFGVDVAEERDSGAGKTHRIIRPGDFHEECLKQHLALFAESMCVDIETVESADLNDIERANLSSSLIKLLDWHTLD